RLHLGWSYQRQDRFAEAVAEFEAAVAVPPVTRDPRLAVMDQNLRGQAEQALPRARRMAALVERLPAVLAGRDTVPPAERCDLAMVCLHRRQYRDGERLFADA